MEERVIRLEERLAFAERDVETLSGVVRELADALEATRREMARLHDDLGRRVGEVEGRIDETATDVAGESTPDKAVDESLRRDQPPHWGGARGS